jgi:hypothetical protein
MLYMKKISLTEAMERIEDTRRERSVMYPLIEIIMIVLLGVMCGATSYAKIEMFGKSKEEWLKKFLRIEYGTGCVYNAGCDKKNRYEKTT